MKAPHFTPIKSMHREANMEDIYMKEIVRLHGIQKAIVSDKAPKFTSKFWQGLFKIFGTNLNLSTTYHPYIDGKTERVNQVIENMLRMNVMDRHINGKITCNWWSLHTTIGIMLF